MLGSAVAVVFIFTGKEYYVQIYMMSIPYAKIGTYNLESAYGAILCCLCRGLCTFQYLLN